MKNLKTTLIAIVSLCAVAAFLSTLTASPAPSQAKANGGTLICSTNDGQETHG